MKTETTARVYVGTYAKYNSGSIAGQWLDLADYADKEAFLEACAELHKDEADPELMFQDFEGFPREFYGESCIKEELWEWLELDDDDKELLAVYLEHVDQDGDIQNARESFNGKFGNREDWASNFLEDTGSLSEVPESLRNYIDFDAYARDAELGGDMLFVQHDGECWAFNRNI